jgi:hypothetical protein
MRVSRPVEQLIRIVSTVRCSVCQPLRLRRWRPRWPTFFHSNAALCSGAYAIQESQQTAQINITREMWPFIHFGVEQISGYCRSMLAVSIVKPYCPRLETPSPEVTKSTTFSYVQLCPSGVLLLAPRCLTLLLARGMHVRFSMRESPGRPCPRPISANYYRNIIFRTSLSPLEGSGSPLPTQRGAPGEALVIHLSQPPPLRQGFCCRALHQQTHTAA